MSAKFLVLFLISGISNVNSDLPIVLNTWTFTNATIKAWEVLADGGTPLNALVEGCSVCEREQCDGTVGYGGSPDEDGETTLDAMIMDGSTMNVGAVANLRQVKDAIAVARHVLLNTKHSLLAGDQATTFALQMGFKKESLSTAKSKNIWKTWKAGNCQPNFWENVKPNPLESCGPYKPAAKKSTETHHPNHISFGRYNHDTIGMIVIDKNQKIYAGTSTNGAKHKIPGRVGDSPIPGAGAYADNEVGAAAATGDGDVMMRFLPAFLAVENLRSGQSTTDAAKNALMRILKYYPNFFGGLIVAKNNGEYGAACSGMKVFPFSVYKEGYKNVNIEYVECLKSLKA